MQVYLDARSKTVQGWARLVLVSFADEPSLVHLKIEALRHCRREQNGLDSSSVEVAPLIQFSILSLKKKLICLSTYEVEMHKLCS